MKWRNAPQLREDATPTVIPGAAECHMQPQSGILPPKRVHQDSIPRPLGEARDTLSARPRITSCVPTTSGDRSTDVPDGTHSSGAHVPHDAQADPHLHHRGLSGVRVLSQGRCVEGQDMVASPRGRPCAATLADKGKATSRAGGVFSPNTRTPSQRCRNLFPSKTAVEKHPTARRLQTRAVSPSNRSPTPKQCAEVGSSCQHGAPHPSLNNATAIRSSTGMTTSTHRLWQCSQPQPVHYHSPNEDQTETLRDGT